MKIADTIRLKPANDNYIPFNIISKMMSEAVIVDITNVANYYYCGTDQELWNFHDFPNIAPPWPRFFMGWKVPSFSNSEGKIIRCSHTGMNIEQGVYIAVIDKYSIPLNRVVNKCGKDIGKEWINNNLVKWLLKMDFYISAFKGKTLAYIMTGIVPITPAGILFATDKDESLCTLLWNKRILDKFQLITGDYSGHTATFYHVPFLAISFSHCKNVNIIEQNIPIKVDKIFEKRHGMPRLRYHIIEIEPMKKILKSEGNIEEHGLKKALHICRGHFKDYRERGLFGKYKDIYWWESHVRGSPDYGITIADYKINPGVI